MTIPESPSKYHYLEPDFSRGLYHIPDYILSSIFQKLDELYGKKTASGCIEEFKRVIQVYHAYKTPVMLEWEKSFTPESRITEKDVMLITYGDLVVDRYEKHLKTLGDICHQYLRGVFNTIHILPFFPYSSDRGFAIMDFRQVDPNLGTWDNILEIKDDFKLMFDGVFNHISSKSFWFQEFLNGNPDFDDFFTAFPADQDIPGEKLSKLFRPRTSNVLTPFHGYHGKKMVWTTFSPDQVDLKFQNPKVLLKMLEIMLYYVRRGADFLRLDAVTYLWDELGSTGAHLSQTHTIIKLFREVLDVVAPHVTIVTETNVPHEENITYFGNGYNEAQVVYNFALPPLVLYTFYMSDATILGKWLKTLKNPSEVTTFLNFLDSHDGIGVMGARGILQDDDISWMAEKVKEHGGLISYRTNPDGSLSPYELNITFYSAINNEDDDEPDDIKIRRYLAARSIPLVISGMPGVYLHGLLGSKNDIESAREKHDNRSINRNILSKDELLRLLDDENSITHCISYTLSRMIYKRVREKAFHPQAPQRVLDIDNRLFSISRISTDGKDVILAITNVTGNSVDCTIDLALHELDFTTGYDILSKKHYEPHHNTFTFTMEPYQVMWLKAM